MDLPAMQRTVMELVAEYEEKDQAVEAEIARFESASKKLELASTVQGKFIESIWWHGSPSPVASAIHKNLLKSGWQSIYDRLQIDRIASARDKRLFSQTLADPPPLTIENAKATFGDYLSNLRFHLLRGLAEVFADLDPAYKSHSKVKIGVQALPKRIIIPSFGGYGSYGRDKLRDVVNALAAYRGQPLMEQEEFNAIDAAHSGGEDAVLDGSRYVRRNPYSSDASFATRHRGLTIRRFKNGNAHVIFAPDTLADINRALAEFYGEVMPDVDPENPTHPPSRELATELQYYPSPSEVIDRALAEAGIYRGRDYSGKPPVYKVLEPSCGDGRMLDEIAARGSEAFGIEYHPGRAAAARAKGHNVLTANFLECTPNPIYDRIVMNPPFYGRHYVKHVQHALRFLRPGGILVSILPATSWYDHKILQGRWQDLPVASFAGSGTNIPTGILRIECPEGDD